MERERQRHDVNKEGDMKGEEGGSLRSRSRGDDDGRGRADDDNEVGAGIVSGSNADASLRRASADTTAATNIETVEQIIGRGRDRVVVMRLSARGNTAGKQVMKARVREKMREEKGQRREGEKRESDKRRRRDGRGSEAAPADVEVMMMSVTMGGLQGIGAMHETKKGKSNSENPKPHDTAHVGRYHTCSLIMR